MFVMKETCRMWSIIKTVFTGVMLLYAKHSSYTPRDLQLNCPSICDCFNPWFENGMIVNCSIRDLTAVPSSIPRDTTKLFLSGNRLSNHSLQAFKMLEFPVLKLLNLSHNGIEVITSELFDGIKQWPILQQLDLSNNLLSTVPTDLPVSVKQLNLSNNVIRTVSLEHLSQLTSLEQVQLQNNQVDKVTRTRISKDSAYLTRPIFKSLQSIVLSKNKITNDIDSTIDWSQFLNLKYLALDQNKLTKIRNGTLSKIRSLENLDLSYNLISVIESGALEGLQSLKYLQLSHNNLITIPQRLSMVLWFDISYNNLTKIHEDYKTIFYPTDVFNIANNPLTCDCNILWLKELYDTREYTLKYLVINKSDFVPQCEEPKSVKNQKWNQLVNEDFKCKPQSKSLHRLEFVQAVKSKNWDQDGVLSIAVTDIRHNSVNIHWANSDKFHALIINFYVFGTKGNQTDIRVLPNWTEHILNGLNPQTKYVICVKPADTTLASPGEIFNDNCVNITTNTMEDWQDNQTLYQSYSFLEYLQTTCLILPVSMLLVTVVVWNSTVSLNRKMSNYSLNKLHGKQDDSFVDCVD